MTDIIVNVINGRVFSKYDRDAFAPKKNEQGEWVCLNCGKSLAFDKRRTNYCSYRCTVEYGQKYYENWESIKLKVFERDNWICQMCGRTVYNLDKILLASMDIRKTLEVNAECDHIVPLFKGGKDWHEDPNLENLQTLCKECHRKKSKQEAKERTKLAKLIREGKQRTLLEIGFIRKEEL